MGAARLRTSLVLAYGAGSIGSGIISTVPGLLLLFYLTDTLGVPAGLAGMAVLLPRLLDLVSDPIVGAWSGACARVSRYASTERTMSDN